MYFQGNRRWVIHPCSRYGLRRTARDTPTCTRVLCRRIECSWILALSLSRITSVQSTIPTRTWAVANCIHLKWVIKANIHVLIRATHNMGYSRGKPGKNIMHYTWAICHIQYFYIITKKKIWQHERMSVYQARRYKFTVRSCSLWCDVLTLIAI